MVLYGCAWSKQRTLGAGLNQNGMLELITELRGGMRSRPLDAPSTFQIVSMLYGDIA